jgi:N-sulfoglucosamine sulfohydrolase
VIGRALQLVGGGIGRAASLVLLLLAPVTALAGPPNLVLIMAEDLSPRMGVYGDPVADTPNIDGLAAQGVRYARAFTTAGVCAPSRAAILMGVHQDRWGAGHMRAYKGGYVAVPPADWKGFPELLRAQGYWVTNNGKTDVQMSTTMQGAFGGPSSLWDDGGADDWRGRAEGQPFFAYITLGITHEGQLWPTWNAGSWMQALTIPLRWWSHRQWVGETDPRAVAVPPYYPDTPTVRADIARHYNNIAAMDRQVAGILAKLEEDGVADETIVVFTTDHGDGLPRAKRWLYDSGLHIPLVVRWPGQLPAGEVREELVSGVDFAPTFLDLAGAEVPAHMEGRVLVGPRREPAPDVVFAARGRIDESPDAVRAVRDARFKYIRNLMPDQPYVLPSAYRDNMPMTKEMHALAAAGELEGPPTLWYRQRRDPEELYDTATDPHEIVNLAGDPAHEETQARLSAVLDAWLARAPDLGLLPEAELAERFWPGGEQPETAPPTFHFEPEADESRLSVRSGTDGASIELREGDGPFTLYTGPRQVAPGTALTARAVRYGYAESEEVASRAP